MSFGRRLKKAIKAEGMTQSEFARKIHVDAPWVSNVIAGNRYPSFQLLQAILLWLPNTDARKLVMGSD